MENSNAFDLIQSMTMSEKRQFVIYSERHVLTAEKKYLQIYKVLSKYTDFKAKEIKAELQRDKYQIRFFNADLNYLYTLLLKHLKLFHHNKTANILIKEKLISIEILFEKGLYKLCMKEIVKAKQIAEKFEMFDLLLNILFWERKTQLIFPNRIKSERDIVKEMQLAVSKIVENVTYVALYDEAEKFRQLITKTRSKKYVIAFKKLMQSKLLVKKIKHISAHATMRQHQIYAMWYYVTGEKQLEFAENKAILHLLEEKPFFKEEFPFDFIAIYSRILSILKLQNEKVFYQELEKFRAFKISESALTHHHVEAQIFVQSYQIQLSMYINTKQFSKAAQCAKIVVRGIQTHRIYLKPQEMISLLFMMSYSSFSVGDFANARIHMNQLLNTYKDEARADIYNFAKILNLMIHLELKNYSNIKSEYLSATYYFKKRRRQYKTENLVLSFFGMPQNYKGRPNDKLNLLKQALDKIQSKALEKFAFNYIDFYCWIESKIERTTMDRVKVLS